MSPEIAIGQRTRRHAAAKARLLLGGFASSVTAFGRQRRAKLAQNLRLLQIAITRELQKA